MLLKLMKMVIMKKNISDEINKKKKKQIEEKLDCKLIRINPDEQDFNIHKMNNEILCHINQ